MKKEYRALAIIFLLLVSIVGLYIARFNFNPSATIILGQDYYQQSIKQSLAPIPQGIVVYPDHEFDGQFFYTATLNLLDYGCPDAYRYQCAYRYQRIIYPALVAFLSLGNIAIIPTLLILVNIIAILVSSYLLMHLLKIYNANLNYLYLWALNVGLVIALTRDLAEPLMFVFILSALYAFNKAKHGTASMFLVLAILTREIALLVIIPLLLFFLFQRDIKRFFLYSLPIIVYAAWQGLIWQQFGRMGFEVTVSLFGIPFLGIWEYLKLIRIPRTNLQAELYFISVCPVIIFCLVQLYVALRTWAKRITFYFLAVVVQSLALLSLIPKLYTFDAIDGIGRYATVVFLFSILYTVERRQRYHPILLLLAVSMSLIYVIALLGFFYPPYFVT